MNWTLKNTRTKRTKRTLNGIRSDSLKKLKQQEKLIPKKQQNLYNCDVKAFNMHSRTILVLSLFICWTKALPVRVPVYTYPKDSPSYIPSDLQEHTIHRRQSRRPNSDFNRLVGNKLPPIQADESQDNDDDYDQSDNEVPTGPQATQSSNSPQNQNKPVNTFDSNYISGEERHKKRKTGFQLCIPFQAYPNNHRRFRRAAASQYIKKVDPATGRTFLVLGDLNLPGSYGSQAQRPYYDNTQPQNDKPGYGLGQVQYQPVGGYPCVPVNFGGGNQLGNRPFGSYFGSYGGYNRPGLGFFGNNGLLNFGGLGEF